MDENLAVGNKFTATVSPPGGHVQNNDQCQNDEQGPQRKRQLEIACRSGDTDGNGRNFNVAQQDQPSGVSLKVSSQLSFVLIMMRP